ncbi:MAG: hypothetical protein GTN40_01385 [Candidatus Aenigmarchaeota archaeon]|nr:hypothetical protein [Candidatus Aenigmarchaeota archaeon]
MVGEKKLKSQALYALSCSKANQTEVVLFCTNSNLTRFANNTIHQNTNVENIWVSVRSVLDSKKGKKVGVASANVFDKNSIKEVVFKSNEIAKFQKPDPHFKSLPKPKPIQKIQSFSEDLARIDVEKKIKEVNKLILKSKKEKMIASGAFSTEIGELAVANSFGVWAYHPFSELFFSTIISSKNSSGYAHHIAKDLKKFDIFKLADEAIKKAKRSRKPTEVKPGIYDVILEEYAVGDMLGYLAYLGFGGKAFHEGKSFASGKLGKKILGENITIFDDPHHPDTLIMPLDWEGVPRRKVPIVEKGILKNVVYDSYTAGKYGKESTGHAYIAPNPLGPLPLHLVLMPGEHSKEDMIRSTKKGIWVTRFHYANVHHFKKLNLTGMTRDGTFLIENGEIVAGIKNLRFTQSIPEALNKVEMIGRDLKLNSHIGMHLAPVLKIKDFNFTSKTEF